MIKLIIFDLDGVLVDSRDIHYYSLNNALSSIDTKYKITYDEHLSVYDGLNTTKKLQILTETKNLDPSLHKTVWTLKQKETLNIISDTNPDSKLITIFRCLKDNGYNIAVASNSIRNTVQLYLLRLGILEYVDYFVSNEDVKRTKPFPEMYWKCMTQLNVIPKETLIIEDSHIGRKGALDSGANLLAIENSEYLTLDLINNKITELDSSMKISNIPWIDKKLNVVVAMAGSGNRFASAGYTFPKPLIDVFGKPMIQVVIENLNIDANYIFLVQEEHIRKYNIDHMLKLIKPDCKVVPVSGVTEGSPCTVLLAKEYIDNDNPILLCNCDQYIEWDSNEVMYSLSNDDIDGGLLVFEGISAKWSFCKLNESGFVERVAEKDPISNIANTGIYYWKHGSDFVKYAEQMISKNIRFNNEYYTAPVYNEAIQDNKKIKIKYVNRMWGLGVPEDLQYFLNNFDPNKL